MTTQPNQQLREGIARVMFDARFADCQWPREAIDLAWREEGPGYMKDADAILAALPSLIDEEMVERAGDAVLETASLSETYACVVNPKAIANAALRAAFGGEGA